MFQFSVGLLPDIVGKGLLMAFYSSDEDTD